jgi:hypothetical protein
VQTRRRPATRFIRVPVPIPTPGPGRRSTFWAPLIQPRATVAHRASSPQAEATQSPADEPDVPLRFCECGCGARTSLILYTDKTKGRVKGQPNRFINGHNATNRAQVRYLEVPTGYRTPCWIWQLAKGTNGYGMSSTATGKVLAHRLYYEHKYGPIPTDRQLDHLCRVRACVNPDHLEPVTGAENVRRDSSTKLTPEIVRYIRGSAEKQAILARRFGVDQSHVSRIKSNDTWRDID